MSRRSTRWAVVTISLVALALPACGGDDEGGGDEGGGGGGTVDVTLQEFAVIPGAASAPAGSITFDVTNDGPDDDHEFLVISTDLAPDALPTVDDGSVDEESGEGIEVLDEIPEFPPGESHTLTLDLDAGSYVLICNVYDADEDEAHYAEGMRVAFSVT